MKEDYNNDELKKIIEKEVKKQKKSGGSFLSHLLAGVVGAVVAAVIIIFAINVKTDDKTADVSSDSKTENQNITINAKEDSIESAVVDKTIDSVVGITTISESNQPSLFGPQSGYVEGVGSGVIVTKDGYILTNSHVVNNGDTLNISVLLSNDETVDADLIWNDETLDLAVIKIDKNNLKPIEMTDSDKVEVGDKAIAIGNPLGLELQSTVTSGIISGLNRSVSVESGVTMDGLMQTDAAINAGNSGGALLNKEGKLVGINTAKAGNSDGIGFAIPINTAKAVIDQIKEKGTYDPVYLGITGIGLDAIKPYFEYNHIDPGTEEGVFVQDVYVNDSPFKKGDIITKIGDKEVKDMSSLKKILLDYRLGDSEKITIVRDNKKKEINFKFELKSSDMEKFMGESKGDKNQDKDFEDEDKIFKFFP